MPANRSDAARSHERAAFAQLVAHCDAVESESDEAVWVAFRVAVENARVYVQEAESDA